MEVRTTGTELFAELARVKAERDEARELLKEAGEMLGSIKACHLASYSLMGGRIADLLRRIKEAQGGK